MCSDVGYKNIPKQHHYLGSINLFNYKAIGWVSKPQLYEGRFRWQSVTKPLGVYDEEQGSRELNLGTIIVRHLLKVVGYPLITCFSWDFHV